MKERYRPGLGWITALRPALRGALHESRAAGTEMNPNFFAELKRRNVYKVAIAYAVVAWLAMQIASQIFPFFDIPNWAILLVFIGVPINT